MIMSSMVQRTEQVLEWPVLIDCLANEAAEEIASKTSTTGAAAILLYGTAFDG